MGKRGKGEGRKGEGEKEKGEGEKREGEKMEGEGERDPPVPLSMNWDRSTNNKDGIKDNIPQPVTQKTTELSKQNCHQAIPTTRLPITRMRNRNQYRI